MTLRKICFALSGLFLLYMAIALLFGIFNEGSAVFLAAAALLAAFPFWWGRVRGRPLLRRLTVGCVALTVGGALALSARMAALGYRNPPPEQGQYTLIVLGARLIGTEPSVMLANRLAAALEVLNQNPQSTCIVSGGQGDDEILPEAEAMAAWLIERGIDPERIIVEPHSRNTEENLRFSLALLPDDSEGVAIVTDGFHQMRAALHAGHFGVEPYAVPSVTPWGLLPVYWTRELGGVVLTWLSYQG